MTTSSNVRITAQLILSESEAYVAYSSPRQPRGPNGETFQAHLLHTKDGGNTWTQLDWQRSVLSQLQHWGYPTWPPETVSSLEWINNALTITHRDEWVPYEPGGESLWQSVLRDTSWQTEKIRPMDYEGADDPSISTIQLRLPSTIQSPKFLQ